MNDCINFLFPTQILLCESKRLIIKEDQDKLKQLKKDIFDQSVDMTTIKKYNFKTIRSINELTTTTNISYFKS